MTMIEHLSSQSMSASFLLRSLTANERRPHLLLDCTNLEVECILLGLRQWGAAPLTQCRLPGPLLLPRSRRGTLLLQGVHRLNRQQQITLFDWMSPGCPGMQVISITSKAIDTLVESGQFLEGLFHRLNEVRLDIESTHQPRWRELTAQ
jgi:transcriptional regulator of aromatic amino acid metabolism